MNKPVSAARATLRRLRWLLAALFTVTNTLGLVLFAWLAVRSDAQRGRQELDGDLQRVTLAAIQKLDYSGGSVGFADLQNSGLSKEDCFAVLPGGAAPFLGMQSDASCLGVPLTTLNQLATQAVQRNDTVTTYGTAAGHETRLLAEVFGLGKPSAAGAVVAFVNAGPTQSRHDRMLAFTAGGCIALIAGVAVAGYFVAGRTMRPAANTLEQQELLLAESAHDLRTPVAALRALAETALQNPDQRAELLPRTVSLSQRMGDIIGDLLTRARLAAGVEQLNVQPVRLDQLVAGVVENTPRNGGTIALYTSECTVAADPALLQRAIGNLLDNALRHGRTDDRPAEVDVLVGAGRIMVADHGPGMRQSLSAVPFNRGGTGSTGLGLSIVRWIVGAHGGTLTVHNAPTGGAVFEMSLNRR